LRVQVLKWIAPAKEHDLLVPRTAERFVVAGHGPAEPAKDPKVEKPPDLVKYPAVPLELRVTVTWLPTPSPMSELMDGVAAEHANGQAGPSRLDVLAEKTELRGLLKWLAARNGHSFYAAAGKNPFS
jgi:hypothetical protein